jgi:putative oxidoreductase
VGAVILQPRLGLPRGPSIRDDHGGLGSDKNGAERDGMTQFATAVQGAVSLLGRLMIVLIFLSSAVFNKIPHFQQTAAYMATENVPNPKFALFGAIGLLLLGSLSVALGAWTRFGAIFLFVFLAAATYYFHDFWTLADPGQRQLQQIQFMKNLAIGGGLLSLMAFGGGPWSVDGWIGLKQAEAESAPAKPRVTAKPQQG